MSHTFIYSAQLAKGSNLLVKPIKLLNIHSPNILAKEHTYVPIRLSF